MDDVLRQKVKDFLSAFELVFEADWEYSKGRIKDSAFIKSDGTFLSPNVDDEENNWANRGTLLSAYHSLARAVREEGIATA